MGKSRKPWLATAAVDMRVNFLTRSASAALVLIAAFCFSCNARAINIGEVVSQSKLGEPLLTKIELTGSGNEVVEDACLYLAAPGPDDGDPRDFLTVAKLAVKTEGKQQFVVVSSHKPYNDLFIRFKLQVKCVGIGNVVKSFTILPDFPEILPNIATPVVAPDTNSAPVLKPSVAVRSGGAPDATGPNADQDTLAERRRARSSRSKRSSSTIAERDVPGETGQDSPRGRWAAAPTISGNRGKPESFRLRLAGGAVDESRIGKISPQERNLLLARQKLLDSDDQMASFLALQDQVKQLQAELGMVKLRLGQLGLSSSAVTPSVPATQAPATQAPATQAPATQAPATQAPATQAPATQAPVVQADVPAAAVEAAAVPETGMQRGTIIVGLLSLLGILLGVRYYMRTRGQSKLAQEPLMKRPAGLAARKPASDQAPAPAPAPAPAALASKPNIQAKAAQQGAKQAGLKPGVETTKRTQAVAAPIAAQNKTAGVATPSKQEKMRAELADFDSIIEEAELYAIHGHPDRAILIIKELLQSHPTQKDAWMLLFSIYSSMKAVAEFEQASRDFQLANKDSSSWPEIQALGRLLDPDNTLYAESSTAKAVAVPAPQAAVGKRALIGDILLAMGALSEQDMKKCLSEFDPKVDGRFGGFLIKRNLITEAQLDAALEQQKLQNDETNHQSDAQPDTKKDILAALKFEVPPLEFPTTSKSLESDSTPGGKPDGA